MQASVLAQVAPFDIPRGVASILTRAKPSQKFSARAVGTVGVPTGAQCLINVCPCICNDTTYPSAWSFVGSSAQLVNAGCTFTSTDVGSGWANATSGKYNTNTPYSVSSLAGGDYKWRLVSFGVRVRNTTAQLNRGGVLKYLVDREHTAIPLAGGGVSRAQGVTFGDMITQLNANHKVVRYNSASTPDIEISVPCRADEPNWNSAETALDGAYWYDNIEAGFRAGGTTSTNYGGLGPLYIYFENGTGYSQNLDLEILEHWEVNGSAIEILHTTSASHAGAFDLMQNLAATAHHQHSLAPHIHFKDVVKGAIKLEHNKAAMQDVGVAATALAML